MTHGTTNAFSHMRWQRDGCGDQIISGTYGHLYEHGAGVFGLMLEDSTNGPTRSRTLLARRQKGLSAGFRLHQVGGAEAILLFDPNDAAQANLAIRLVGAKRTRRAASPTVAQLQVRSSFSARAQSRKTVSDPGEGQISSSTLTTNTLVIEGIGERGPNCSD